jgi:hypothetical protein
LPTGEPASTIRDCRAMAPELADGAGGGAIQSEEAEQNRGSRIRRSGDLAARA